jgi:outer membrane protein TolC
LTVAITKLYYALAVEQRKYATAQQALDTAKRFYTNTQNAENVGQAAHSDVIQAEIQYRQQEQAYQEASLGMESARLDLAVLLFPTLNENFSVVDDLDNPVALPPFAEAEKMAAHENPELRVAMEELRGTNSEVLPRKALPFPHSLWILTTGLRRTLSHCTAKPPQTPQRACFQTLAISSR